MPNKKNKRFITFKDEIPIYELLLIGVIFGLVVSIIGMSLNFQVIRTNGGMMPVYYAEVDEVTPLDEEYFLFSEDNQVRYPQLTDRFLIADTIYSIGDFFLYAGMITFSSLGVVYFYKIIIRKRDQNEKTNKKRSKN